MTPKNAKFEEATTLRVELRQSDIFLEYVPILHLKWDILKNIIPLDGPGKRWTNIMMPTKASGVGCPRSSNKRNPWFILTRPVTETEKWRRS